MNLIEKMLKDDKKPFHALTEHQRLIYLKQDLELLMNEMRYKRMQLKNLKTKIQNIESRIDLYRF